MKCSRCKKKVPKCEETAYRVCCENCFADRMPVKPSDRAKQVTIYSDGKEMPVVRFDKLFG